MRSRKCHGQPVPLLSWNAWHFRIVRKNLVSSNHPFTGSINCSFHAGLRDNGLMTCTSFVYQRHYVPLLPTIFQSPAARYIKPSAVPVIIHVTGRPGNYISSNYIVASTSVPGRHVAQEGHQGRRPGIRFCFPHRWERC